MENNWLVLLNPHAGCGKGKADKETIIKLLHKYKLGFELVVSKYPRHAIVLTKEKIEQGFRKIIVAGGDGTLNEVVNGIFIQEKVSPEKITVGMIPVGTGNDWIKTFGIPADYEKAVQIILDSKKVRQDIGKVLFTDSDGVKTRYFANMAGFGFDAMVADKANRFKDKGRSGLLVYLQSLLGSYIHYSICKTKITIDEEEINELLFSASIGIGKFNGGGMMQAPFAVPDNGEFQVTVIRKIGIMGILRNLARIYTGSFIKDKRVSIHKAFKINIEGSHSIPGEVDGEILGNSSFSIEMVLEKLAVIYGNDKFLSGHPSENTSNIQRKPERFIEKVEMK